jgi:hypothetical protein
MGSPAPDGRGFGNPEAGPAATDGGYRARDDGPDPNRSEIHSLWSVSRETFLDGVQILVGSIGLRRDPIDRTTLPGPISAITMTNPAERLE